MGVLLFPKKGVGRFVSIFGFLVFIFWFLFFSFNIGERILANFFDLPSDVRFVTKTVHAYGVFLGVINYFLGFLLNSFNISKRSKVFLGFLFMSAGVFTSFFRLLKIFPAPFNFLGSVAFFGDVFFTIGLLVFVFFNSKKILIK